MKEIRYETPTTDINFGVPTVFFAGPTVRRSQTHLTSWRPGAADLFRAKGFEGNVIIPEFTSVIPEFMTRTETSKYPVNIPMWEFECLQNCKVIMFWIPRTKELIGLTTNHEHGYWTARCREKMVYGRPVDAYRTSYLDFMWTEDATRRMAHPSHPIPCPIYSTLESTVDAALELLRV